MALKRFFNTQMLQYYALVRYAFGNLSKNIQIQNKTLRMLLSFVREVKVIRLFLFFNQREVVMCYAVTLERVHLLAHLWHHLTVT